MMLGKELRFEIIKDGLVRQS